MANPIIHSESSVHHFGGNVNDYLAIHEKMDCSKMWIPDNRHRILTHTMFWVKEVMIPIFGSYITNSDSKKVSVKDICERHILEDYKMKFIPTPQDFIQEMNVKDWMKNGNGICPSAERIYDEKIETEYKSKEVEEFLKDIPPINFDFETIIMDGGPNAPHNRRRNGDLGGFGSMVLD